MNRIFIDTNKVGQRILVIGSTFTEENLIGLDREDFEAILYLSTNKKFVFGVLLDILNPLTNNQALFKPIFLNPALRDTHIRNQFVDGYVYTIDDDELIRKTESISAEIQQYDSRIYEVDITRGSNLFLQILRYWSIRGEMLPSPLLKNGSCTGYARGVMEYFYKYNLVDVAEGEQVLKFMKEKKYLESIHFINKVHLCPRCMHSHLLFLETCPKCASSKVLEEPMIHHFRCANISPERTYVQDNQMICPKCRKRLRHIGVDYDRPTTMFSCQNCNTTFVEPDMKVVCVKCNGSYASHELIALAVEDMRFTEAGRQALKDVNIYEVERELTKFNGLVSFSNFTSNVKSRIEYYNAHQEEEYSVAVIRVQLKFAQSDSNVFNPIHYQVSDMLYSAFSNQMIAMMLNTFYINFVGVTAPEIDNKIAVLTRVLEETIGEELQSVHLDFVAYKRGSDVDAFIRNLLGN